VEKIAESVTFLFNKIEHMGMQEALGDPEGLEELEEVDPELFQMIVDYRKAKIGIEKHLRKSYNWTYREIVKNKEDESD